MGGVGRHRFFENSRDDRVAYLRAALAREADDEVLPGGIFATDVPRDSGRTPMREGEGPLQDFDDAKDGFRVDAFKIGGKLAEIVGVPRRPPIRSISRSWGLMEPPTEP